MIWIKPLAWKTRRRWAMTLNWYRLDPWYWSKTWRRVHCWMFPRNRVTVRNIHWMGADAGGLLEHVVFSLVCDFVEKNHDGREDFCRQIESFQQSSWPENGNAWATAYIEMLAVYDWYRCHDWENCDDGWDWRELEKITGPELIEMERSHHARVEEMAARAFKVRGFMWT